VQTVFVKLIRIGSGGMSGMGLNFDCVFKFENT